MKLEFIDHNTYKKLDCEAIFDELHNDIYRKYGKIINANSYIKIAWSSDILLPQFLDLSSKIYAIGIDQNFAIYDFEKKHRIMYLDLMFLFCEMVKVNQKLFIATELEVIVVDLEDYNIIDTISLPDMYDKIEINCDKIDIHCLENILIKYYTKDD